MPGKTLILRLLSCRFRHHAAKEPVSSVERRQARRRKMFRVGLAGRIALLRVVRLLLIGLKRQFQFRDRFGCEVHRGFAVAAEVVLCALQST